LGDAADLAQRAGYSRRPEHARQPGRRGGSGRHRARNPAHLARHTAGALGKRANLTGDAGGLTEAASGYPRCTPQSAQQATEEFVFVGGIEAVRDLFFESVPNGHIIGAVAKVGAIGEIGAIAKICGRQVVGEAIALITLVNVKGGIEAFGRAVFHHVGVIHSISIEWSVHQWPPSVVDVRVRYQVGPDSIERHVAPTVVLAASPRNPALWLACCGQHGWMGAQVITGFVAHKFARPCESPHKGGLTSRSSGFET
jgi:hypothetical protein